MSNGVPTPGAHDGMAAFAARHGRVFLIRSVSLAAGTITSAGTPGILIPPTPS